MVLSAVVDDTLAKAGKGRAQGLAAAIRGQGLEGCTQLGSNPSPRKHFLDRAQLKAAVD
jgi:hypothetical protein